MLMEQLFPSEVLERPSGLWGSLGDLRICLAVLVSMAELPKGAEQMTAVMNMVCPYESRLFSIQSRHFLEAHCKPSGISDRTGSNGIITQFHSEFGLEITIKADHAKKAALRTRKSAVQRWQQQMEPESWYQTQQFHNGMPAMDGGQLVPEVALPIPSVTCAVGRWIASEVFHGRFCTCKRMEKESE